MNTYMHGTCKCVKYMLNFGENMLGIALYSALRGNFGHIRVCTGICTLHTLRLEHAPMVRIQQQFGHLCVAVMSCLYLGVVWREPPQLKSSLNKFDQTRI